MSTPLRRLTRPRDERITAQLGFSGGVNLRDAPDELSPIEAAAILNIVYTERGAAQARLGCTAKASVGSAGDRILSQHVFYREADSPQHIVHTSAGELKYSTDLASYTDIATGLSHTEPFSYQTFNGKVYMSNGIDDYMWWDGTTPTTDAAAPKGRYITLWKDTMFLAGIDTDPTQLWESAAGDAETWPIDQFTHLSKDDGDPISGLSDDGYFLVVFKRSKGYIVYDAATLANRCVDYEKGCESHFSIVTGEDNHLYYFSREGIVRWNNQAPGDHISLRLDPLFDAQVINLQHLNKVHAYKYGHRTGWAIPEVGQTVPSFQIEMYPHLPEFPFTIHRMPARNFATWRKDAQELLIGGATNSNKTLDMFTGETDDGAVFPSFIQTGWLNFDWANTQKYLRFMRILGRGSFTCNFLTNYQSDPVKLRAIDLGSNVDLWDDLELWDEDQLWGEGSSSPQVTSIHPDVYGRQFSFRFSGTVSGSAVRDFDLGGASYLISSGQWGINEVVLHAINMGDRV